MRSKARLSRRRLAHELLHLTLGTFAAALLLAIGALGIGLIAARSPSGAPIDNDLHDRPNGAPNDAAVTAPAEDEIVPLPVASAETRPPTRRFPTPIDLYDDFRDDFIFSRSLRTPTTTPFRPDRILAGASADAGSAIATGPILSPGWNLLAWTGDGGIDGLVQALPYPLEALFAWDPAAQEMHTYRPGAPDFLNTLEQITSGDAVLVALGDGAPTPWRLPSLDAPRTVPLYRGANLVTWTGPSTPAGDAVAPLHDSVRLLWVWDTRAGDYRSYRPSDAAAAPLVLDFGTALWIDVSRDIDWPQPSRLD